MASTSGLLTNSAPVRRFAVRRSVEPCDRTATILAFPYKTRCLHGFQNRSSGSRKACASIGALRAGVVELPPNSELVVELPGSPATSKVVLVFGGTGGVGQLVVASLLKRNIKTHLFLRDPDKAASLFGKQDAEKLQVWQGDTRNPESIDPSMFEGVTHVICCTGTTAFPSKRWDGENSPERVDWEGVRNLVSALPSTVKRIVLVSSIGVTKFNELPWSIMNLFGVLKYKKMGEHFVRESSIPYTILRPGRLTDGPYTSYDLNTLLKATSGQRRAVIIGQGDKLVGEASRIVVAEACTQLLDIEFAEGETYEINSVEVQGVILRNGGSYSELPKLLDLKDITGREYLHVDDPSGSSNFDLLADPYTTSGGWRGIRNQGLMERRGVIKEVA